MKKRLPYIIQRTEKLRFGAVYLTWAKGQQWVLVTAEPVEFATLADARSYIARNEYLMGAGAYITRGKQWFRGGE